MSNPVVYGFPRSTFVNIVRMVLTYKEVPYDQNSHAVTGPRLTGQLLVASARWARNSFGKRDSAVRSGAALGDD